MDIAQFQIAQFLYHEARLLDLQKYEDWLALYAEDATYWIPLEKDQADPLETSSLVHDDRTLLELRVRQTRHPRAHARLPAARTVHQVSNVQVLAEDAAGATVASTLLVVEFRSERQRLWAGLVEHRLRRDGASWKIARKRIDLVDSEGEMEGLSILL